MVRPESRIYDYLVQDQRAGPATTPFQRRVCEEPAAEERDVLGLRL